MPVQETRFDILKACDLLPRTPITIVAGHYGVGKTNFSLNLALDWAALGVEVTLIDLDVVNPYFRSSDYHKTLEQAGVRMIAPLMAGTTLDSPSLSGAVSAAVKDAVAAAGRPSFPLSCKSVVAADASTKNSGSELVYDLPERALIVDAGGDDVGSTALGCFAQIVEQVPYTMFYVVNRYRNLTQDPLEAASLLSEIEYASHLKATAVVNNSHLKDDTDATIVLEAQPFGLSVAHTLDLPLACSTAPQSLVDRKNTLIGKSDGLQRVYPVQIYVRTPWE